MPVARVTWLIAVSCAMICAQDPYGTGTPGSGGIVPTLRCGQAWLGNAGFAFQVNNALGGATAFLGVSAQPASLMAGGTAIWISPLPADLLLLDTIPLGGAPGAPGAGSGTYAIPLTMPVNPALAGSRVYAQVAVTDLAGPGTYAASAGLRVELTLPPMFAYTESLYAPATSSNVRFFDPTTMTEIHPPLTTSLDPSNGMAFGRGGRDLFIARSNGMRIDRIDFSGATPVSTPFFFPAGQCYGVVYDRDHDLLYTLVVIGSTGPFPVALVAIDANPQSPAFGAPVAGVLLPNPSSLWSAATLWGYSYRASRLCILNNYCPAAALEIVDADPASPTYLQVLSTSTIPQQITCFFAGPVATALSPDGQFAYVLTRGGGGMHCNWLLDAGVARLDLATGVWDDFNPSVAGTQNVSAFGQTPIQFFPTVSQLHLAHSGQFAIASGAGWHLRMDFGPLPGSVSLIQNVWYSGCYGPPRAGLSGDDATLLVAAGPTLLRLDAATLAVTSTVAVWPVTASVGTEAAAFR